VLPPGDWNKKNLLSMSDIMELKRKKRIRLAAMEKLQKDKDKAEKAAKKAEQVYVGRIKNLDERFGS
jgi:hypothetical protein